MPTIRLDRSAAWATLTLPSFLHLGLAEARLCVRTVQPQTVFDGATVLVL